MDARPIRTARFAFVDVETTGLSPATSAVVEVACQVVEHGAVVATFETLVDPGCEIPFFATRIHGITDDDVAGKPSLAEIAQQLADACDAAVIVAHNAPFDRSFLPFLDPDAFACSYRLAARVVPEAPNHKNDTLRQFFRVRDPALVGRRAHRALADVIVTRHVFFHCIDRYLAYGYNDTVGDLREFLRTAAPRRRNVA